MKVIQKAISWFKDGGQKPDQIPETSNGKTISEELSAMSHLQEYLSY